MSYFKVTFRGEFVQADTLLLPSGLSLTPANHTEHTYPVDGWTWFDTADEAAAAMLPSISPGEVAALRTAVTSAATILREADTLPAPVLPADLTDIMNRAAEALGSV